MAEKQIWDLDLEVKALKTVLGGRAWSAKMYGLLKPEHFHYKVTKTLFVRLQEVMLTIEDDFPSWQMLVTDSKLESGVQAALQDHFEKSSEVTSDGDLSYIYQSLDELAKKRAIYASIYEGQEGLYDQDKSATDIASEISSTIIGISHDDDMDTEMCIGVEYNDFTEQVFQSTLNGVTAQRVLPSGYTSFDTRSFGFLPGDLVLLGASTGGGKSTMALNMLTRQHRMGKNVVLASYEMSYDQLHGRHLSLLSEVPHDRIRSNNLTAAEKRNVECVWREFNLHGKRNGNGFWITCPTKDQTVYEVGYKYKSRKPDIFIFDYINFLTTKSKKVVAESQWQMLGEISREGKILARKNKCVVVMLMQIDKEHNIRYAKAIQDHADWAWGWVVDEEAKMNGFVNVKQLKARSGNPYEFQLVTRFDVCQFRDPEEGDKDPQYTEDQHRSLLREAHQYGLIKTEIPPDSPTQTATPLSSTSRVTPSRSYIGDA